MKNWQEFFELAQGNIKDKNLTYLHGIIWGLYSPYKEKCGLLTITSSDVDTTTYHALVRDKTKFDLNSTLKDALTGKNISDVVERFSTTNVDEAFEFYKKYNNLNQPEDESGE